MKALSIEQATKRNLKQSMKELVGSAVSTLAAKRTEVLFESPEEQTSSWSDKLIMAYLKRRAVVQKQDDFFERLHQAFWKGEGGNVFAENCDHRFEDLFLAKQQADFDQLRLAWNRFSPKHIVEFGCNSGLLLNYLSSQFDGIESITGIELNEQQVQKNRQSPTMDPRIQFHSEDAGQWLLNHGRPNSLFVTNGGVLEYFRRERLDQMLSAIVERMQPAIFFSVEPVAIDHDWSQTTESIPFGEELSFSHNYPDLFESNGFQVIHQRSVAFDLWNMVATIAISQPAN